MAKTRVMIVEDEDIVALDIKKILKNLGYDIAAVASTGKDAIKAAMESRPDLILMDIKLKGGMDGVETATRLRNIIDTPTIYITAYSDDDTLKRAKITEPFGYLLKPFESRELYTAIEMALYKHRMEKKLRDSEEWLSTTLKSIGDAVITTDTEGYIIFMNVVAEKLTGWKLSEAKGKDIKSVFKIIDEETYEVIENPVKKVIEEGVFPGRPNHTILISRNGKEIPIEDNASPIKDDEGNIIGVVMVFKDITDRKRAEALQSFIYRISERTGTAKDMQEFYAAVHKAIGGLLYAKNFYIALYDEEEGLIKFPYSSDEYDTLPASIRPGKGLTEYVLNTGQPLMVSIENIHDLVRREGIELRGLPALDWLGVPLKIGDNVIGVLAVQSYSKHIRFGEREKDVLMFASQHIASAMIRKQAQEALRKSEERLRRITDNMLDMISQIDTGGVLQYVSPSHKIVMGYEPAHMLGKPIYEYVHPDDAARVKAAIMACSGDPSSDKIEFRIRCTSGNYIWLEAVSSPLHDKKGGAIGAIFSSRDITDRKKAEEALLKAHAELEKRVEHRTAELTHARNTLQAILDTVPIGVIVAEADTGRITYCTKGAVEILGTPLVGNSIIDEQGSYRFLKPDGSPFPLSERPLPRSLSNGERISSVDIVISRPDGNNVTVLVSSAPVYNPSGRITAAVASIIDITERKRAEEALRESEEKFRNLIENINDWVWEVDENLVFTYSSPKILDIVGYEPEKIIGKSLFDLMAPDEAKRMSRVFERIVADKKSFTLIENTLISMDGHPVIFESSGTPKFDSHGAFNGFRGINRDITERKRAEKALLKSEVKTMTLLNAVPDLMLWVSKDGVSLEYKAEKETDLLVPPEVLIGKNIYETLPTEQANILMSNIKRALNTGTIQVYESQVFARHDIRYEEIRCVPSGKDEALVIVHDITERKRAEQELRTACNDLRDRIKDMSIEIARVKATLQTIFDTVPAGIIVVEAGTEQLSYVSKSAVDILGGPVAGIISDRGVMPYRVLRPDRSPFQAEELPAACSLHHGEHVNNVTAIISRNDGAEITISMSSSPIMNKDGHVVAAIISFIDITMP